MGTSGHLGPVGETAENCWGSGSCRAPSSPRWGASPEEEGAGLSLAGGLGLAGGPGALGEAALQPQAAVRQSSPGLGQRETEQGGSRTGWLGEAADDQGPDAGPGRFSGTSRMGSRSPFSPCLTVTSSSQPSHTPTVSTMIE